MAPLRLGATKALWNSEPEVLQDSPWQPASSHKAAGRSAPWGDTSTAVEEDGGQEAPAEFPELCFLERGATGLAEAEKPGWGFAS